jgi:alpha-L-fucosidase 2
VPAQAGRPTRPVSWAPPVRPPAPGRPPRPGRLDLLPALPAAWPAGSVRGLAARSAVTVRRLSWAAGRYEAVIESRVDQDLSVSAGGGEPELLAVTAGRPVRLAGPIGRPARAR